MLEMKLLQAGHISKLLSLLLMWLRNTQASEKHRVNLHMCLSCVINILVQYLLVSVCCE